MTRSSTLSNNPDHQSNYSQCIDASVSLFLCIHTHTEGDRGGGVSQSYVYTNGLR